MKGEGGGRGQVFNLGGDIKGGRPRSEKGVGLHRVRG
jgi:hypothetical protein